MTLADLYARPGFLLRRAHQVAVGIFVEECALHKLTPQARALMRRAAAAIERTSERLLAPLRPGDRRTFVDFLMRLARELNESSRSPVVMPAEAHERRPVPSVRKA